MQHVGLFASKQKVAVARCVKDQFDCSCVCVSAKLQVVGREKPAARRVALLSKVQGLGARGSVRCAAPARRRKASLSRLWVDWCGRSESNRHSFWERHFECRASTSSATPAIMPPRLYEPLPIGWVVGASAMADL